MINKKDVYTKKTEVIHIRCTAKEKNKLKGLAGIYASGNLSEMMLTWLLDGGHRQFIKKKRDRR